DGMERCFHEAWCCPGPAESPPENPFPDPGVLLLPCKAASPSRGKLSSRNSSICYFAAPRLGGRKILLSLFNFAATFPVANDSCLKYGETHETRHCGRDQQPNGPGAASGLRCGPADTR